MEYSAHPKTFNLKIRAVVSAFLNRGPETVNGAFCLVHSLLAQTHQNIEIVIHHDGPLKDVELAKKFRDLDSRIIFLDNLEHKGFWGFPHRWSSAVLEPNTSDFTFFTNEDNYYLPTFARTLLESALENNADIVNTDFITSHGKTFPINEHNLGINGIDMGAFIVKTDLVKSTPFVVTEGGGFFSGSDGRYYEELKKKANKIFTVRQYLFVHN
jgi:hypothetical protein